MVVTRFVSWKEVIHALLYLYVIIKIMGFLRQPQERPVMMETQFQVMDVMLMELLRQTITVSM